MKKIVALLMASVLTLSLCSCWGGNSGSELPTGSGVQDVSDEVQEDADKTSTENELEKE